MQLLKKAKAKVNLPFVIAALVVFIIGMVIMRQSANAVSAFANAEPVLDLRMGYSVAEVSQYLVDLGEEGRLNYYNNFYPVDLFYPIAYAVFYFSVLVFLLKLLSVDKGKLNLLLFLPILGLIFDWGENLFIRSFINDFPVIVSFKCQISALFTVAKFLSVYGALLSIILLLILLIIRKVSGYLGKRKNG
jgi:hypothetical protein